MTGTAAARTTRLLATGALTIMLLAVATPAAAHTRAAASSNYESRILTTPDIPGAAWRLYAGGDIIELTHRGSAELIVLGYADEPYLRLGPAGTFENRNSPATYLNADRYGDVAVPPRADPSAAPEWRNVSDEPTWTWHDHRVHWMSPEPPPVVRDDPGRRTLISGWTVPVEHDGAALELAGQLWWTPGPASWPYLAMGLLVTSPAAAGLVARARGRRLRRPAAAMTAAVAALNGIHFLDELLAWPAPTLDVVFGVFHTALFVGVGLIGAAIAWRGRFGPNLSLGIASGAVLFHQGLLQVRLLSSSQLPTVWPPALLRAAVALSVAQAIWVTVVLWVGVRAPAAPPRGSPGRSSPARSDRRAGDPTATTPATARSL